MSGGMHEQMSRKREREHTLMQSLPGLTRTLRILHYTKDQIPASHRSETGGIEGLLIFNEGQNTYSNQHTDFMRILLQACNLPNVWNYTRKGSAQELAIPIWHAGHVLPIHGPNTTQSITDRIKAVAEDNTDGVGLKMKELKFIVVPSQQDLVMSDATAKFIHMQFGITVPAAIATVDMRSQLNNQQQDRTPPRAGSTAVSACSSPANSISLASSSDLAEGLQILRGVKRSMQARGVWVEADAQSSQCAQM